MQYKLYNYMYDDGLLTGIAKYSEKSFCLQCVSPPQLCLSIVLTGTYVLVIIIKVLFEFVLLS